MLVQFDWMPNTPEPPQSEANMPALPRKGDQIVFDRGEEEIEYTVRRVSWIIGKDDGAVEAVVVLER